LWVYRDDVSNLGRLREDPIVTVTDPSGHPLGKAFYSPASRIALRILSRHDEPIRRPFWRRRIREAAALRKRLGIDGDAYRLLYGEADLVPSIIVDRYGDYLVAQFQSAGADAVKREIVQALVDEISPAGILERSDRAMRQREGLPKATGALAGTVPPVVEIEVNGLRFEVNLEIGQKTGGFLDQRENYLLARRWATGRVADCFCYSGGFALHAAGSRNVQNVVAVDSSEQALEMARVNAGTNGLSTVRWISADVFRWLKTEAEKRRRYETVILDPPAFARSRSGLGGALRGYKEINLRAMTLLCRGGVLITCSCSQHVSQDRFAGMLREAARDAGRRIQILEKRGQPPDHPVLATMPETEYLKCFVLRVL
jgi:23S rRNA (cytosine1962-C5)-methyltransferase